MEDAKLEAYHDKIAASAPRGGRGGLGALGELRGASSGVATAGKTGLYAHFVLAGQASSLAANKREVFEAVDARAGKRPRPDDFADAVTPKRPSMAFEWQPAVRAAVESAARLQMAAGARPPECGVSLKLVRKAVCSAAKKADMACLRSEGASKADIRACMAARAPRQEAFAVALASLRASGAIAVEEEVLGLTADDADGLMTTMEKEGTLGAEMDDGRPAAAAGGSAAAAASSAGKSSSSAAKKAAKDAAKQAAKATKKAEKLEAKKAAKKAAKLEAKKAAKRAAKKAGAS